MSAPDGAFRAFRVFDEDGTIGGRVVQLALDDLTDGAVVIRARGRFVVKS
ncbi:MAG: hypothetical protein HY047_21270 [Acidobacteria bacterium]|nr:hypothetical protein [Acidobacteriota bacterium]